MTELRANARMAGLAYLGIIVLGPLSLIYIPNVVLSSDDPHELARSIALHEGLMRLGIFSDMLAGVLLLGVGYALYRLFKTVAPELALMPLILGGIVVVPIEFVNELNEFGALTCAQGGAFLAGFTEAQRDGLTMLFVHLHHYGIVVQELFWGLWLFPMGILAYRSGVFPKFIGVWLLLNGCYYLARCAAGILAPAALGAVPDWLTLPLSLGEIAFTLWLFVLAFRAPSPQP
jgi:hypothetical protein